MENKEVKVCAYISYLPVIMQRLTMCSSQNSGKCFDTEAHLCDCLPAITSTMLFNRIPTENRIIVSHINTTIQS